ncbi:DUF397 domain-containing protein [Micromonospora sp. NBC_01699]|uniref:DUF397 domain-containing protein n=1 Tax=Micromonospora sp. NBC_01699 TaxID=2975984 RepID=UPI002E2DC9F3|nr:DUF397 domain-containing protein [Micromonospora sp. NBC_01699]
MDLTSAKSRGSTRSSRSSQNGGDCVEVADNLPGVVAVRDTKNPGGGVPTLAPAAWRAFVGAVPAKRGG